MAAGGITRSTAMAAVTVFGLLATEAALAQNPQALFPPNVILPNNYSLPIGQIGGLEGNAYTARASDPTALWFNPAGIAGANVSTVSASTGSFRVLTVSPQLLEGNGHSLDCRPASLELAPSAERTTTFAADERRHVFDSSVSGIERRDAMRCDGLLECRSAV
jgi:hypothetical protein